MKWAPEDRLDEYAARLLAEQPDAPRTVSLRSVLAAYVFLLSVLLIPAVLFLGSIVWTRQLLPFAILFSGVIAMFGGIEGREIVVAKNALQSGLAAPGEVTRVEAGYKGSRRVTFRVDVGGTVTETQISRAGGADVLVQGDVVQLMLDPQTHEVLYVFELLKPSPLYAPPKG